MRFHPVVLVLALGVFLIYLAGVLETPIGGRDCSQLPNGTTICVVEDPHPGPYVGLAAPAFVLGFFLLFVGVVGGIRHLRDRVGAP